MKNSLVKSPAKFVKERKELVGRLLKNCPTINWPRELLISKKLFELIPSPEFWLTFEIPGFVEKCDSLCLLLGPYFKEFLRKEYNRFLCFKQQTDTKIIDSPIISNPEVFVHSKPNSLKDFLNS